MPVQRESAACAPAPDLFQVRHHRVRGAAEAGDNLAAFAVKFRLTRQARTGSSPYVPYRLVQCRGQIGMLMYYDHVLGRYRFKRRYKWAVGALTVGIFLGMLGAHFL